MLHHLQTRDGSAALFSEVADAAIALRPSASTLRLALVDASDPHSSFLPSALPEDLRQVSGLPSLVVFQGDSVSLYRGGRTSAELQLELLQKPPRTLQWIDTREQLTAIVQATPRVVLLLAGADGSDGVAARDVAALAQTDDLPAAYVGTTNTTLFTGRSVESAPQQVSDATDTSGQQVEVVDPIDMPTLVVFRQYGNETDEMPRDVLWTTTRAATFMDATRFSRVAIYSAAAASALFDRRAAAHVLLFANSSAPEFANLSACFAEVAAIEEAKASSDVARFLIVPALQESELCDAFAVVQLAKQLPTLLVVTEVSEPAKRFPLAGVALLDAMIGDNQSQFVSDASSFLDTTLGRVATAFGTLSVDIGADTSLPYDSYYPDGFQRWSERDDEVQSPTTDRRLDESDNRNAVAFLRVYDTDEAVASQVLDVASPSQLPPGRFVVAALVSPRCNACRSFAPLFETIAAAFVRRDRHDQRLGQAVRSPAFVRMNVDQLDDQERGDLADLTGGHLPAIVVYTGQGEPVACAYSATLETVVSCILDAEISG